MICIFFRRASAAIWNEIRLITGFPPAPIPLETAEMIINPDNCYFADDTLISRQNDGKKNRIFRVGKEITEFNDEQVFHLTMFFDKLIRRDDMPIEEKLYYKDVAKQLMARGAVPECDGSIRMRQIVNRSKEVAKGIVQKRRRDVSLKPLAHVNVNHADHSRPEEWRRILITGWYGTETTGDKAILGELMHFIRERSPSCEISLTTLDRKISIQTNREMESLGSARLLDIDDASRPDIIEDVDAVIVGGGPLMQSDSMGFIRAIFREANKRRKARVIFGCGMGPFHTKQMEAVAADILRLSTAGFFRDQESMEYASKLAPDNKFRVACDPALGYLNRWLKNNDRDSLKSDKPVIATLLRANTREFAVNSTKAELGNTNLNCAGRIARILEAVSNSSSAQVKMLAMNAPWIGGDDRLFNRMVAASFSRQENVFVDRGYSPLEGVIRSLAGADAAVAMRYHGHLFCLALGIPFLSVDYTGKSGKVSNLVKRIKYDRWSVKWNEMNEESSARMLLDLLKGEKDWEAYLYDKFKKLVLGLEETYNDIFGATDKGAELKP